MTSAGAGTGATGTGRAGEKSNSHSAGLSGAKVAVIVVGGVSWCCFACAWVVLFGVQKGMGIWEAEEDGREV